MQSGGCLLFFGATAYYPPPTLYYITVWGMSDLGAQRQATASFREILTACMTRDSLRIVPPVFLDRREAFPTKTLAQE